MSLTNRVTAGLKARGVSVTFIRQGHLARVTVNGEERMATEEQFAYRDCSTASNAALIDGLVASILSKSKGRRRATLREVVVNHSTEKAIAHTCVGFL